MERDPAWSPDGQWIAYFSDESGEYELHVRDSLGRSEARKIRLEQQADVLSDAPLVARQQEDRVSRRAPEHLVRGHRSAQTGQGRQGPVSVPAVRARARVVAGQQMDRLLEAASELSERDLHLLARRREEPPAHRRAERRAVSGLRRGRQTPVLHGEHRFRSVARA